MKITIQPLTIEEKKAIRRVFRIRVIFFFIFILPLILAFAYTTYLAVTSLFDNRYDVFTFVALILIPGFFFLAGRYYFVPFYRDSYRNLRVEEKQVVETTILNKEQKFMTKSGLQFRILTEFNLIDTYINTVLIPDYTFINMNVGDHIRIHILQNNKLDILRIEKIS